MQSSNLYFKKVTKKLHTLLLQKKNDLNKNFILNQNLFSSIRERSLKLREKPLSRSIKLELHQSRSILTLTFSSGLYPNYSKPISADLQNYFPLQISFSFETTSFLCESICLSNSFDMLSSIITSHPVQIPRSLLENPNNSDYRGRLPLHFKKETNDSFYSMIKEKGVDQKLIDLCVDIARDKEERLKVEWIERVFDFINAS